MSLLKKVGILAAASALAGVIAYGELVLDWRTPDAKQSIHFALTSSAAFLMADYNRLRAASREPVSLRND